MVSKLASTCSKSVFPAVPSWSRVVLDVTVTVELSTVPLSAVMPSPAASALIVAPSWILASVVLLAT